MKVDLFGIRRRQAERAAAEQAWYERVAAIGSLIKAHREVGLEYKVAVEGSVEATVLSIDPPVVQPHGLFRRPSLVGKLPVRSIMEVEMTSGERYPFLIVEAPNGTMYGSRVEDAVIEGLGQAVDRGQAYLEYLEATGE